MDREKVIKALECCKRKDGNECKVCPYTESEYCVEDMVTDAIALLNDDETRIQYLNDHIAMCKEEVERLHKEQEAIKPRSKVRHGANAQIQHFCGNCNTMLHGKPKFCSECGRPVLWESR